MYHNGVPAANVYMYPVSDPPPGVYLYQESTIPVPALNVYLYPVPDSPPGVYLYLGYSRIDAEVLKQGRMKLNDEVSNFYFVICIISSFLFELCVPFFIFLLLVTAILSNWCY